MFVVLLVVNCNRISLYYCGLSMRGRVKALAIVTQKIMYVAVIWCISIGIITVIDY